MFNSTKNKDLFVSVVTVLFNDADILRPFLSETVEVLESSYQNYELVLVDDGSYDATPAVVDQFLKNHYCIRYIRLSRKFGIETAFSAGLDTAIGDVIITLEPESDPPSLIPATAAEVLEKNCIVFNIKKNRKLFLPFYYRAGKKIYYGLCRMFLKFYPPEDAGFFMGLSRQHLNSIVQIKDKSRFLRVFSSQIGFGTKKVYYDALFRRELPRRRTLFESLQYLVDTIVANSIVPLRITTYLGFFAAVINFIYIAYIVLANFLQDKIAEGWTTSSLQNATMFLLMFIILTVFSEYLIRLIEESKDRALYFIVEEKNSSVMIPSQTKRRNVLQESL